MRLNIMHVHIIGTIGNSTSGVFPTDGCNGFDETSCHSAARGEMHSVCT